MCAGGSDGSDEDVDVRCCNTRWYACKGIHGGLRPLAATARAAAVRNAGESVAPACSSLLAAAAGARGDSWSGMVPREAPNRPTLNLANLETSGGESTDGGAGG